MVGTVLATGGLLLGAAGPVAAVSVATCDYVASTHKVKVTISGSGNTNVYENGSGQIWVNSAWCENKATVTNTDRITILAGVGNQEVNLHWNGGGFQPGATDEPGDSDEIEIALSLAGGDDSFFVKAGALADKIRVGKSSGFGVIGRINLNAAETTGIDADITIILGLERLSINGAGGSDNVSAAGGAGTGDAFTLPTSLYGTFGNDTLTGGTAADKLQGDSGNDILAGGAGADSLIGGADADTLKGGGGPDYLHSIDGVSGNDELFGGLGADVCVIDPGDSKTSC